MRTILLSSAAAAAMLAAVPVLAQPAPVPTAAVSTNVLLQDWTGPYDGVPPWDKVKPEQFPEALQAGIDEMLREIDAIAFNKDTPTFANTIEAMEKSGQKLDRVTSVFGVMTDNMSTPAYQALDKDWSPKLSAAYDKISLNGALFQRIQHLYDKKGELGLDAKQDRLLTRTYEGFVRRGAKLNAEQKAQLTAYNQQLASAFPISIRACWRTKGPSRRRPPPSWSASRRT